MVINKNKFFEAVAIFLVLLYPYTKSIADSLFFNSYIKVALVMLGYAMLFLISILKCKVKIKRSDLIIVPIIAIVLINNKNIGSNYFLSDIFFIFMLVLLMVYFPASGNWIKPSINIIKTFSVFYAICTIVFKYVPSIYLNYAINLMPSEYYNTLLGFYRSGYMAGLTQHYSMNGIYLSIGTMLCFSCLISGKKKRAIDVFFLLVNFYALILTAKRAHLLFTCITLILVILICANSSKKILKYSVGITIGVGVLYAIIIAFPTVFPVIERFKNIMDTGTRDRLIMYAMALNFFSKSPIFGNGWCSFRHLYYSSHSGDLFSTLDVHNIYIQMLTEVGIIGFLLFIFFMGSKLKKIIKYVHFQKSIDTYNKELIVFSLSIQIFFVMYGMTGNPLYDCQMFIPYILGLGIAEHFYSHIENKQNLRIR